MSQHLKDLLNQLPPDVDAETLMRYLQGQLSDAEQHAIEKQLLDAEFEADAIEGLQQVPDAARIPFLMDQLKRDLKKKMVQKKAFRDRLRIKEHPILWAALLLILLLVVISYLVVHRLHHG